MLDTIMFTIKTESNLFIGGAPAPFEIGGIDQQTAVDIEGFPCIPASSFKGALRNIIRKDTSAEGEKVKDMYQAYLQNEQKKDTATVDSIAQQKDDRDGKAFRERMANRYEKANEQLSAQYIFGIREFNHTPKLLFNDLLLLQEYKGKENYFSIDMKNSIDDEGERPVSNPRTYKAARKGLVFAGQIQLFKIEQLGDDAVRLCKAYIMENLKKFNAGVYRLGNSKSRGYGRISVNIAEEALGKNV